jgi:hypothetical protein
MTLNNSMSITPVPPAKVKGARFQHGSVLGGKTRRARVSSQWKSTETATTADAEVMHRRLSEVQKLTMRESASLKVDKCIYPRLPYPSRSGGLERAFHRDG